MVNSTLRVYWRGGDSVNGYSAELYSSIANYTCRPALGVSSCDMDSVLCGNTYSVVVAPLTLQGTRVLFCPRRLYSGEIYSLLFVHDYCICLGTVSSVQ